jgi:hypothetical protein
MLASPLASLFVALRFYKSTISQIFLVIFAFYFGMRFYMANDITIHFVRMRTYYCGKTWLQIMMNPDALGGGLDYYHIVLKYIISRFSRTKEIFAAVNCALYSGMFLFFFNQFKEFYKKFLPVSCGILLLVIVFTVEFYWYQGVRFWIGVFYFAAFFLRYLNTGKKINLLFLTGCVFFHYTLVNLLILLVANWMLSKIWVWFRVILLGVSFIYRMISFDFMGWIIKNVPGLDLGSRTVAYIHEDMLNRIIKLRQNANLFYSYRSELMIAFGVVILMIFWSRRVKFSKKYLKLFFFAMTIYTAVNFAYAELIFFDRFLKIGVLMFYSFLFVTACQNYEKIKGVSLIIMILSFIPMCYAIATPLVEMRGHLLHHELWFGNFFVEWQGGMSEYRGRWYVE